LTTARYNGQPHNGEKQIKVPNAFEEFLLDDNSNLQLAINIETLYIRILEPRNLLTRPLIKRCVRNGGRLRKVEVHSASYPSTGRNTDLVETINSLFINAKGKLLTVPMD
jgi:hypothetical protein